MSEASWWLELLVGVGVSTILGSMLVYVWKRLGRVRFYPSDWRMNFSELPMPGFVILGEDHRTSPDRANMMECVFSVKMLNGKRVDTTLDRVTGVFHLPGGSTHPAKFLDPQARNFLESLHLPAKQPVTKVLWIHVYASDVGRDVMVKLASTERVVFDARYPWGWRYRKQIYPSEPGRPWWRRMFGG